MNASSVAFSASEMKVFCASVSLLYAVSTDVIVLRSPRPMLSGSPVSLEAIRLLTFFAALSLAARDFLAAVSFLLSSFVTSFLSSGSMPS